MRKALLILIVTLFATPALAGCLGGGDEVDASETECDVCGDQEVEVGLGGIKGKVLDDTLSPVAEANVTIRDMPDATTRTDASGAFAFSNLEPGEYTIFAQKEWFQANGKAVTVEADAVVQADVQLTAIAPPPEPHLVEYAFENGFIACGVSYGPVKAKDHCGEPPFNDPNSKAKFDFIMDSGLTGLMICMEAETPQAGTEPDLSLVWSNPPTLGESQYEVSGQTPYCMPEPFEFGEEDTWRETQLPTPEDTPATFEVRLDNPELDTAQPNYAYQMQFKVYMGVFYNGEPIPDGYDPRPKV